MSTHPKLHYVVLGGGISGCAVAYFLRAMDANVTLIEKEYILGGIAQSYQLRGLIYDFGPHMLHATNSHTINFYKQFDIREVDYFSKMSYDGTLDGLVDFPFSLDTIFQLPREIAKQVVAELYKLDPARQDRTNLERYLRSVNGDTLYRIFNHGYSHKFWGMSPENIPSNAAASWISFRTEDKRLYPEWQAYPRGGFNSIYKQLTKHVSVLQAEVQGLGKVQAGLLKSVTTSQGEVPGEYFISTLSPEVLLRLTHDACLMYVGKIVVALYFKEGPFNPLGVGGVYFPSDKWRFNRIVEYPVTTNPDYPSLTAGTVITMEYPLHPWTEHPWLPDEFYIEDAINSVRQLRSVAPLDVVCHRHPTIYPFRDKTQLDLYHNYRNQLEVFRNLSLTGRYGNFVYVNMNHCVEMAAKLVASLCGVSQAEVFEQAKLC